MPPPTRLTRFALLAIGLLESLVVLFHVLGIQQTPNWQWPWRNAHAWPLYPAMVLAAVPLVGGGYLWNRNYRKTALAAVFLSAALFQPIGQIAITTPPDWLRPCNIIEDRICSSYFSDAQKLVRAHNTLREILANYPAHMRTFYQHSQEKPPGPVLFYVFLLRIFGLANHVASAVGALIIALATAAGVPATYALAKATLRDRHAAFYAATLYALVPSVIAAYPVFDTCYPAVIAVIALLTIAAMRKGRPQYAIALGLAITLASFFVYNLLTIGTFLLGLMLIELTPSPRTRGEGRGEGDFEDRTALDIQNHPHPNPLPEYREREPGARALQLVLLAAITILLAYTALYFTTGFNPIATFQQAIQIQKQVNIIAKRPYPQTIPYDFFDFLFGTGRMLALLALLGVARAITQSRAHPTNPQARGTAYFLTLCLIQIAIVGLTGLLRGETARVWCFMVPLITIPAAHALKDWPPRWRYTAIFIQGLLMLAMVQNIEFNSLSLPGS